MIASAGKFLALTVLLGVLLAVALVYALVGTTPGTRFLAARAGPFLPAALSFTNVGGTLLTSVSIDGLRWRDENTDVHVPAVTVDLALRPLLRRDVQLKSVLADNVSVTIVGRDRARETPGDRPFVVDLPVDIIVDDLRVTTLHVQSREVRESFDAVALQASLSGPELTVERIEAAAPWLTAKVSGQATLAPPYSISAGLEWEQTAWSGEAPLTRSEGRLDIEGALSAFQFSIRTSGEATVPGSFSLSAQGDGSADEVRVLSAEIQSGSAGAHIDGEVVIRAEGAEWNAITSVAGLELARLRPDLEGTIALDASVNGAMQDWRAPHTEITIDALTGTLFGKPLSGQGFLSLDGTSVSFKDVAFGTGENDIGIDGKIADDIALEIRVDASDLGAILPELAGRLGGQLQVSGTPAAPRVGGQLDGANIGLNDLRADVLRVAGAGDRGGELELKVHAEGIRRGGQQVEVVDAILTGALAHHKVTVNVGYLGSSAKLTLEGSYGDSQWSGRLTQADAMLAPNERWSLVEPAAIEAGAARQSVTGLCMSGGPARRICADFGAETAERAWHLTAAVGSLPLAPFIESRLPRLQSSGRINANAALEYRDGRYQGTFDANLEETVLSLRDAAANPVDAHEASAVDPVPVYLSLSGTVDDNRLSTSGDFGFSESGDGNFSAAIGDIVDPASSIRSTAQFTLNDLSFASLFVPGADVSGGELTGEVSVAGSLDVPTVGGVLRLRRAEVEIFAAGSVFKDVAFDLVPGRAGEFNFEGSATAGTGRVDIRGVTAIDAEAGWPTRLSIEGQNIDFIRLPDWTVVASPDLDVELTSAAASVSGTITVPSASIKLDQLPATAESPSPDTTVHRQGDESRRRGMAYELDLAVVVEEGVRLQGFGLDTALAGELEIAGTDASALRGVGELNLVDGRFEAYGQKLRIERGRLNFTGSLANPLLDFRATRQVDELMVGITMGGSVEQPQSSVFSDPAMSEASALALLVTGRPLESAGESDGNLVAGAAIALGLKGAGNIGAEIGATLGLDDFSIEGGSTDGRVLAGKRVSKNLYLRYAFGIFDKIGSLLLRYRLSERLTFESESGEEQSLDLIYSVDRQ